MYIKLGSTKINYISPRTDDFIILSEIVDSSLSYYRPVLVRKAEELDIWFGDNFTDRDYFLQLLENGIVLYLYKPIENKQNTTSDFIDYSKYTVVDKLFISTDEIENEYPSDNRYQKIFKVLTNYSENNPNYFEVIYLDTDPDTPIEVSKLPQNIEFISNSLNNRDTLVLFNDKSYLSPSYCLTEDLFFKRGNDLIKNNLVDINYTKVNNELLSSAFTIKFDNKFLISNSGIQFLAITTYDEVKGFSNHLLLIDNLIDNKAVDNDTEKYLFNIIQSCSSVEHITKNKNTILNKFKEYGYDVIKNSEEEYLVRYPYLVPVNYFYELSGISITPNFNITNDMIFSKTNDNNISISFVSKTIGCAGDKFGNIEVTIEDIGDDIYRVNISRFGYSELYEGKLKGTTEELRLDHKINTSSKLVECQLGLSTTNLPEGTWSLKGGKIESYNPENYIKGLESLFSPPEPIYFDYLLIPDIKKYTNGLSKDINYYPEYKIILDYSTELGNQVLIQNLDNWEKIIEVDKIPEVKLERTLYKIKNRYFAVIEDNWVELSNPEEIVENTYYFNYTEDKDNRLLYFYRDMKVYGKERPGYYIYLNDLLFNSKYSPSVNNILYKSPILKDSYLNTLSGIENSLIEKKSNYLVENNHIYYYKNYQNGKNYNSSCWMRFCIDKIKRELLKNKWWILSNKDIGQIKEKILNILNRITNNFSIIKKIKLTNFNISFKEQTIDLTIDTSVDDLVNNNIRIDITLNYYT